MRIPDHQGKNRFRWLPYQHDRRNVKTSRPLNLSGGVQVMSNLDLATLGQPECHDSERVSRLGGYPSITISVVRLTQQRGSPGSCRAGQNLTVGRKIGVTDDQSWTYSQAR